MSHQKALKGLIFKFTAAFSGIITGFKSDRSLQGQYLIALTVIIVFLLINISLIEWMILLGCIGLVISLEYVNSSIELLCDHTNGAYDPLIKKVKDFMAAAVLIASITSAIIGLLILIQNI